MHHLQLQSSNTLIMPGTMHTDLPLHVEFLFLPQFLNSCLNVLDFMRVIPSEPTNPRSSDPFLLLQCRFLLTEIVMRTFWGR